MNLIIAAIAAGLVLLWGGVLALLRLVAHVQRKHLVIQAAHATLVAGTIIGLVLFTAQQRQLEHRRELEKQMDTVTRSLSQLSDKLLGQLEEKANLTASEFEVRARLQGEQEQHRRTREELGRTGQTLDQERQTRSAYQEEQNRTLAERSAREEERYRRLSDLLDTQQRLVQGLQQQVSSLQGEVGRLNAQSSGLVAGQSGLLESVRNLRQAHDQDTQKLETLARGQASLQRDLSTTKAQVDSLYHWK